MKGKSKSVWWVLTRNDGDVLVREYSGPDRAKARSVAAKLLSDDKVKGEVIACRVSRLAVLSESSLVRSLPKDAF